MSLLLSTPARLRSPAPAMGVLPVPGIPGPVSHPVNSGFIASRQTEAHEGETTGAITVGGSDAAGRGSRVAGRIGTAPSPRDLSRGRTEGRPRGRTPC